MRKPGKNRIKPLNLPKNWISELYAAVGSGKLPAQKSAENVKNQTESELKFEFFAETSLKSHVESENPPETCENLPIFVDFDSEKENCHDGVEIFGDYLRNRLKSLQIERRHEDSHLESENLAENAQNQRKSPLETQKPEENAKSFPSDSHAENEQISPEPATRDEMVQKMLKFLDSRLKEPQFSPKKEQKPPEIDKNAIFYDPEVLKAKIIKDFSKTRLKMNEASRKLIETAIRCKEVKDEMNPQKSQIYTENVEFLRKIVKNPEKFVEKSKIPTRNPMENVRNWPKSLKIDSNFEFSVLVDEMCPLAVKQHPEFEKLAENVRNLLKTAMETGDSAEKVEKSHVEPEIPAENSSEIVEIDPEIVIFDNFPPNRLLMELRDENCHLESENLAEIPLETRNPEENDKRFQPESHAENDEKSPKGSENPLKSVEMDLEIEIFENSPQNRPNSNMEFEKLAENAENRLKIPLEIQIPEEYDPESCYLDPSAQFSLEFWRNSVENAPEDVEIHVKSENSAQNQSSAEIPSETLEIMQKMTPNHLNRFMAQILVVSSQNAAYYSRIPLELKVDSQIIMDRFTIFVHFLRRNDHFDAQLLVEQCQSAPAMSRCPLEEILKSPLEMRILDENDENFLSNLLSSIDVTSSETSESFLRFAVNRLIIASQSENLTISRVNAAKLKRREKQLLRKLAEKYYRKPILRYRPYPAKMGKMLRAEQREMRGDETKMEK